VKETAFWACERGREGGASAEAAHVVDMGRSAAALVAPTAAWGGSGEGCAGGAVTETACWACERGREGGATVAAAGLEGDLGRNAAALEAPTAALGGSGKCCVV